MDEINEIRVKKEDVLKAYAGIEQEYYFPVSLRLKNLLLRIFPKAFEEEKTCEHRWLEEIIDDDNAGFRVILCSKCGTENIKKKESELEELLIKIIRESGTSKFTEDIVKEYLPQIINLAKARLMLVDVLMT